MQKMVSQEPCSNNYYADWNIIKLTDFKSVVNNIIQQNITLIELVMCPYTCTSKK